MAFLDKLKEWVIGEDDEFAEDYLDEEPIQPTPRGGSAGRETGLGTDSGYMWNPPINSGRPANSSRPTLLYDEIRKPDRNTVRTNVVDVSPSNTLRALTQKFKIVVVEPRSFEECRKLVDDLKSRKPVIINLEGAEMVTARKIFDFLNGATYALSGKVQKITNNIFVFLPDNVDISNGSAHDGMTFDSPRNNSWSR